MEDLLEKEIRGFKFSDGPGYVPRMNDYIGVTGRIRYVGGDAVSVKFPNGDSWSYPLSEIHEHLVEQAELTIEELLNTIKRLTLQI